MDANPILAEAIRGNWVENRHRGAYIVVDADGRVIASAGDAERPIFPRSAIKSMRRRSCATGRCSGPMRICTSCHSPCMYSAAVLTKETSL